MGINTINCERCADVKESGFGKGTRTSSDFDRNDILKGVAVVAAITAGAFVAGCLDFGQAEPKGQATIKYGPYNFDTVGEPKIIHSESSNTSYSIELEEIEHDVELGVPYTGEGVPIKMGDGMMTTALKSHYIVHIKVTDLDTMEEKHIALGDGQSSDWDSGINVHASVDNSPLSRNIASLTVTEKYAKPVKE